MWYDAGAIIAWVFPSFTADNKSWCTNLCAAILPDELIPKNQMKMLSEKLKA